MKGRAWLIPMYMYDNMFHQTRAQHCKWISWFKKGNWTKYSPDLKCKMWPTMESTNCLWEKSLGNDTLYKLFREDKVHHVFLHSRTIREWKQDDRVTIHILLNRPCCGYISLTLISVLFQSWFGYSRISSDKKYMSNVHSRPVVSDDWSLARTQGSKLQLIWSPILLPFSPWQLKILVSDFSMI